MDQRPGLSQERDQRHAFVVIVKTFGKPEKTMIESARSLGSALYSAFGDSYEIHDVNTKRQIVFDPLAHDGEHAGHDDVLLFLEAVAGNGSTQSGNSKEFDDSRDGEPEIIDFTGECGG